MPFLHGRNGRNYGRNTFPLFLPLVRQEYLSARQKSNTVMKERSTSVIIPMLSVRIEFPCQLLYIGL